MAEKDPKETSERDGESSSEGITVEWLTQYLKNGLNFLRDEPVPEKPKPKQVLDEVSLAGICQYIQQHRCNNIITMAGAGISTSAGIPDFRSEGTGLYHNLEKYNLPHPQAIFTIEFFKENPKPFFVLAKELYPGKFTPTPCHYFIRLLHEKGLLLRHYSQNIDTLERVAGLPAEKVVEAHGTFYTSHCLKCHKEFELEWMKEEIFADKIPQCTLEDCDGVVKPDIVFFGEALPKRFAECVSKDFTKCDLLIIMGTSLKVQPFASLTARVSEECPRLYINLEATDSSEGDFFSLLLGGDNFDFDSPQKYRDVFVQSTCDDGCEELAERIGWKKDLADLIKQETAKLKKENKTESKPKVKSGKSKLT